MDAIKIASRCGKNTAENLPITGEWKGTLDVNGKRSNFVLHIQE